ncbi:hypothetical protein AVEN_153494-1 [Araneus ventricosus]|uniref:Uncharacterized protein n=1 Tax=Araneus ventricosus TaxID=182803 RepID=A0A4Y2K4N4_ARAVE|nr:hypothetical protein AVEN_153494-1 [Araneus ventricosus]
MFRFFVEGNSCTISRIQFSAFDCIWISSLQIVCQSDHCHHIDEHFGQVKGVAKFTGGVVPGEDVMVIVPAFASRYQSHNRIFSGFYAPVKRLLTIFVCSAVYKPCAVKAYAISCHGSDEKRIPQSLAPTPNGYHGWQIEAEEEDQRNIKPVEINFIY